MADQENQQQEKNGPSPTSVVNFRKLNANPSAESSGGVDTVRVEGPGRLSIRQQKESAARRVALIITYTFAFASAAILIGAYRILRWQPTEAKGLLADAAVPLLEKSGVFLSSTFGPLLAFVLGYYFGEKAKDADK